MVTHRSPERRFHDVSNTLQVVKGALTALDLYDADLTPSDKRQLEDALGAAMNELEVLFDIGEVDDPSPPASSLDDAVARARAAGADVRLDAASSPALRWDGEELRGLLTELFLAVSSGAAVMVRPSLHGGEHVPLEIVRELPDGSVRRLMLRLRRV